jgi:hypothetical protein
VRESNALMEVSEVSYQQGADVVAEEGGRKRNSPWRIQYAVGNGPSQQLAIGGEYIDKTISGSGYVAGLDTVVQRVSDKQASTDSLNVERRVTRAGMSGSSNPPGTVTSWKALSNTPIVPALKFAA